jgi:Tfp pilus assembly protein PilX
MSRRYTESIGSERRSARLGLAALPRLGIWSGIAASRGDERGAALVIALLLLAILTLLATTGMRTAVAELWMASSEQFHHGAVEAASAGVEVAIARLRAAAGALATGNPIDGMAGDAPYTATIQHAGTEASLPGSSAEKFVGEHFEIESTGTAARGARDVQMQGVLVVSSTNGVRTFRSTGSGLGAEGSP